jgi:glycosyltransferase involved in cell wall biosynthesis
MKAFKKYPTALRPDTLRWIDEQKNHDVLVGVPTFNCEDSIGHVVETAVEAAVTHLKDAKCALLVSDGGSLDDTREIAEAVETPDRVARKVMIYRGMPGKGTSLRAIFEAAKLLRVKACVVVDSDLRSITPEWVKLLAEPMLDGKADYVAPLYSRHKYDGTITNHIVYPLTRALYGRRIRQPIGGDFGLSGDLAAFYIGEDVWDTDVARFGIDVWMTTSAICEGFRIAEVNLGVKVHDAKDPAADLPPMFTQVISTLYFLMGKYEKTWMNIDGSVEIPCFGSVGNNHRPEPVPVTRTKLIAEFVDGFKHFGGLYRTVLNHENYLQLQRIAKKARSDGKVEISHEWWARVLYDFSFTYQTWNRNRRRLVGIMTPLYFGRLAGYAAEVEDLDSEDAEEIILRQAEVFERSKGYLRNRFTEWED